MSAEEFYSLTPAEFIYAWIGWSELRQLDERLEWDRTRWGVWNVVITLLPTKNQKPMLQMYPMPWDAELKLDVPEVTMEERREIVRGVRERYNKIKK